MLIKRVRSRVRGVSPDGGMVGRICERGRF